MESHQGTVELASGTIHYREFRGAEASEEAPVVFVHGIFANGLLWREVAPALATRRRCVVPDWPLGAHPTPMRPDADLSVPGVARLVADTLEALDLCDVTLVGNDSGGAVVQLVAARHAARVGRIVLTPCDAFEVFPPAMFSYLSWAPRVPGLMALLAKSMWVAPPLRRLPIAFGWLTQRPMPRAVADAFVRPAAHSAGVRRDLGKFLRSVKPEHTLEVARELGAFEGPSLVLWAPENHFFPMRLAAGLVEALADARLVEIPDAGVFVCEDQPEAVARAIEEFLAPVEASRPGRLAS